MTATMGTAAPAECRQSEGERLAWRTGEGPEWAILEQVHAVGSVSGENVVRTFLFVEEMSAPLAERGLSQYNERITRHPPLGDGSSRTKKSCVREAAARFLSERGPFSLARSYSGSVFSHRSAGAPVMSTRDRR